jgi:hypothetical protein
MGSTRIIRFPYLTKMQEFGIEWGIVDDDAHLKSQRIFSYDALNRRNGETLGSAGSTLYTDLAGNMIEERQWGINTTQNVCVRSADRRGTSEQAGG